MWARGKLVFQQQGLLLLEASRQWGLWPYNNIFLFVFCVSLLFKVSS
jgi:hypothetical protein